MKAVIGLELVGSLASERYREFMGPNKSKPWVARLRGLDDEFGFDREFIHGQRDYSRATSTGARGVWEYYALDPGIYEINERVSWRHVRRYFVRVAEDGTYVEISREEAIKCLLTKDFLESTS